MDFILKGYAVNDATWFYLSLLLIMAVFFRFNRLWSLRNLDIVLLLAVSPGLLSQEAPQSLGNIWLFVCTGLFLIRLMLDAWFRRRPLLEQNLNASGLAFLCVAAFAFQIANIVTETPREDTIETVRAAQELVARQDSSQAQAPENTAAAEAATSPTSRLLATPTVLVHNYRVAAWILAGTSHLAVVLGLVFLGKRHLGELNLGIAMATMYLLLPCTAYQVEQVSHVMPAALVIWSLTFYHRPMVAGCFMGLACGTVAFPVFLLPVWMAFYGRNGAIRFGLALTGVMAVLLGSFALTSSNVQSFLQQTIGLVDWSLFQFKSGYGVGFWSNIDQVYRLPVVTAFGLLVIVLAIFPRKKNIEHLMAHSAAIVVATQFWYPQHGGVYVLWYLPLLLTVFFRPKLAHLVPPESAPLLRLAKNTDTAAPTDRPVTLSSRQQLR